MTAPGDMKQLLCIGYGYTARALAKRLRDQGGWSIAGTTRAADKAKAMEAEGVMAIRWSENGLSPKDLEALFDQPVHVLVSTGPGNEGCPALAACGSFLAARADKIAWLGYLSTNGVYGDHGGAWVNEETPPVPGNVRGRRRIAAEQSWRALADEAGFPLTAFRLPGIYGPGRSAIGTVREGRARRIFKEGQVFSRMHVDDIAAALEASMREPSAYGLFNLADDEPAPPQDVIEFACRLLNDPVPPLIPLEEADLSEMGKSFYADNKRVSNERMKEALNFSLRYPTYREGLRAIAQDAG